MKKLFLLLVFASLTARAATYQVALPGGGVLVINGLPYTNPQITNSASVVWTTNAQGLLTLSATAIGTNASIIFVEDAAVSSPNFGVSTEIDPAVVTTNVTFSIVNSSITTNKIDPAFYALLMQTGAGDVTQAGNNTFTGTNQFNNSTTISNLAVTTANVSSMTLATPIGVTAVGTNAADARAELGVRYDSDVQVYRLGLMQAALALTADGHMLVHNGTLVTNLSSTAAGRALLTSASASAQWNNYLLAVASTNGGYDASIWNGVTDRLVTLDQFRDVITALPGGSNAITSVTAPLSLTNGVLSIDTSGLGGGGGGGVTWIVNEPLGSWYGRDTTTNWPLLSVTISSNNLPTVAGQYLFGHVSGIISNLSGTSATVYYNADVNGVRVFRDSYGVSGTVASRGRPFIGEFYLVYETASTASLVQIGTHVSATNPDIGGSGDIANNAVAFQFIATNITVNWSSNITLALGFECDTSTSTNAALGLRKVSASLLKYSAATGSGTGNVTGPASSTNNAIVLFSGTGGTNIADSGVLLSSLQTYDTDLDDLADGSLSGSKVGSGIDAGNITVGTLSSNRLPSAVAFTSMSVGTINATSVTGDAAGLTGINGTNITAGTVAAARIDSAIARLASPTLASPTLNDTVTFEQTILSAHSTVTNFVADPTVSPYQTINADLTTPFATVGFLHATNVAAGRQTTILVFAGTNASVTVSLAAQFARNTNSVALTTGQILPISFYGYGSNTTNVVATMGTPYTR